MEIEKRKTYPPTTIIIFGLWMNCLMLCHAFQFWILFFLVVTNSWYQMNVPLYIYQSRTWRNVVCLVFLINSKWDIISPSSCQEIVRHLLDVCILIFQGSVNDYNVIFLVLQANAIVFIFPESFDCIYALERNVNPTLLTAHFWLSNGTDCTNTVFSGKLTHAHTPYW